MGEQDFIKLIGSMLDDLRGLQNEDQSKVRRRLTENFMLRFFSFICAVNQEPALKQGAMYSDFINESLKLLPKVIVDIGLFSSFTSSMFFGEWGLYDWEIVCRRRSSIEFFREFYRGTAIGPLLPQIDTEEFDDLLREKGQYEGYLPTDKIPPCVPSSHWWWWYPYDPPQQ